jgi:small subunit ribosomal protein S17
MEKQSTAQREFKGVVVSDKMQKTIVVLVERTSMNEKYKKSFKVSRKFKVHDEKNEYKVGDVVTFVETRPISKDKKWRVIGKK